MLVSTPSSWKRDHIEVTFLDDSTITPVQHYLHGLALLCNNKMYLQSSSISMPENCKAGDVISIHEGYGRFRDYLICVVHMLDEVQLVAVYI